jgi:hypothetical protein
MKNPIIFIALAAALVATSSIEAKTPRRYRKAKPAQETPALFIADSCVYGDCWDGVGTARDAYGDLYHGRWFKGVPHGFGSIYFSSEDRTAAYGDGTILIARFNEGKLDGLCTFDRPGNRRLTVQYKRSPNLDNFTLQEGIKPPSARFELPGQFDWVGYEVRRNEILKKDYSTQVLVDVHHAPGPDYTLRTTLYFSGIPVPFLVDTGCSTTSLNSETILFLRRSGVVLVPGNRETYLTACGPIDFQQYTINAISFGGIEYGPFTVSESQGDNLLGMDILSSFGALNINFEQGILKLN